MILSSIGDLIYVLAYNETVYGSNYGVMGQTRVEIDANLSNNRDSETKVEILYPVNHSLISSTDYVNVTADITILGADATNCNATMSFSVADVFILNESESYTHDIGNINRGNNVITMWNMSGGIDGVTNITVISECASDGFIIENLFSFTIYNVSNQDQTSPTLIIYQPENNSRQNNPVSFYYNVTDRSDILNCSLQINDVVTNVTENPVKGEILNFTIWVTDVYNNWTINCTDDSIAKNMVDSGKYNLSINRVPSITTFVIDDPINLIAASNKTVFCNGTITDLDTYSDIVNVNASIFLNGLSSQDLLNTSNHYYNSSCTLLNGFGSDIDFKCGFDMTYFASNGTWQCNATVLDAINATNSTIDNTQVNEMLAIGVYPSVIDFGALEILQISPNDIKINVTNYGNIDLDLDLFAYADLYSDNLSMDCTKGNITYDYERFSINPGDNYNTMNSINNTDNAVHVDLNLSRRQGGQTQDSYDTVYWKLQIPMYTGGTCNGKVVFTAVNS